MKCNGIRSVRWAVRHPGHQPFNIPPHSIHDSAQPLEFSLHVFELFGMRITASLTLYARQTLRDAFPELTQQEIALLFSAVERFHLSSRSK